MPILFNRTTKNILKLSALSMAIALSSVTLAAEVEEFLITATRLDRTVDEIAGTVSLITDEDIEKALMQDLDDLVRYQPGVSMSTASRGGNEGFVIRGIGGNRILMMVDGVRSSDLYAAGPSSYGKDSFEIDDLKAVEIIRGPASVMYGADAMGGAVILRSKTASDYMRNGESSAASIRASFNSANDMGKVGISAARDLDNVELLAQFTHRETSESDVKGVGMLNPQDGNNDALLLKLGWDVNESLNYLLTVDLFKEEIDTVLESSLSSSVQLATGQDETDRYRISIAQDWHLGALLADDFKAQVYWQKTDALQQTHELLNSFSFLNPADFSTYGGTSVNRLTDFVFNQETTGIEIDFHKVLVNDAMQNTFVYGLNYETTETERPRNRCDTEVASGASTCSIAAYPFAPTEDFPNKTFPDTETFRSGIYLQDEVKFLNSGLTLIPGLRYDRYELEANDAGLLNTLGFGFPVTDFESSEVSFNFGLIYDFSDTTSFFAQYAEGFRPPNFNEANQSFVNLGFGYALLPNPDLQEETSQNFELGIRTSFEGAHISFAVYNNDYEDFIESAFVGLQGGLSLFQEQNIGKVEIRGAELQGDRIINDQWSVNGSVAYAKGENKEASLALNSVDPVTAVIGVRFDSADKRWGIEGILTAVSAKDRVANITDVTADSYEVVDLLADFTISDSTKVRLGLFNVFDTQYARWSNIQGLSSTDTTTLDRSQEAGANIRLSFNHQF